MSRETWLSTSDNPFDPFESFDDWQKFDEDHKYFTCNLLARVAMTSHELSKEQNDEEIERAIDAIISFDLPILNSENKIIYYRKIVGPNN